MPSEQHKICSDFQNVHSQQKFLFLFIYYIFCFNQNEKRNNFSRLPIRKCNFQFT